VPIILLAIDYEHREFRFSEPFYCRESEEEDFCRIRKFFRGVRGKNPALGLDDLEDG
jgi:hypothetical protein